MEIKELKRIFEKALEEINNLWRALSHRSNKKRIGIHLSNSFLL